MIAALLFVAAQGPAAYDTGFQRESAATTVYAACLFRENERRRAARRTSLDDFASSCAAERQEIIDLYRKAGRSADVIDAGLQGIDDTMRANIARMNKFYPAESANAPDQ